MTVFLEKNEDLCNENAIFIVAKLLNSFIMKKILNMMSALDNWFSNKFGWFFINGYVLTLYC